MSASIRPTRRPRWARARARLAATVDLPTPPLPLATATRYWTLGSSNFCGPPPGCMVGVLRNRLAATRPRSASPERSAGASRLTGSRLAFGALTQRPQIFQSIDARFVAVVPDDPVGVTADGR